MTITKRSGNTNIDYVDSDYPVTDAAFYVAGSLRAKAKRKSNRVTAIAAVFIACSVAIVVSVLLCFLFLNAGSFSPHPSP